LKNHTAPWWLPGGHIQTIWPAVYAKPLQGPAPKFERERWATPDGDFIDIDFLSMDATPQTPTLVLFHGLEGSSASHYSQSFASWAQQSNIRFAIPHFRGCSGDLNLAPRAYHSGDHEEIDWILQRMKRRQGQSSPLLAAGVSLGGNALMRWAGEHGHAASQTVQAVASICSPLDLTASGHAIGQGFNRQVYTRMFMRSMKPKALAKLKQHPGLFDPHALAAAKDLFTFDNIFTAPLHGFKNTPDYWARASAKPLMHHIAVPALALNALNDPFVPAHSLAQTEDVSRNVELWQPAHGGHVGFAVGPMPGYLSGLPQAVGSWLLQRAAHG
jgi:predicted alpha/beta-fold hydrolase